MKLASQEKQLGRGGVRHMMLKVLSIAPAIGGRCSAQRLPYEEGARFAKGGARVRKGRSGASSPPVAGSSRDTPEVVASRTGQPLEAEKAKQPH